MCVSVFGLALGPLPSLEKLPEMVLALSPASVLFDLWLGLSCHCTHGVCTSDIAHPGIPSGFADSSSGWFLLLMATQHNRRDPHSRAGPAAEPVERRAGIPERSGKSLEHPLITLWDRISTRWQRFLRDQQKQSLGCWSRPATKFSLLRRSLCLHMFPSQF